MESDVDKIISSGDIVHDHLKTLLSGQQITPDNIIALAVALMKFVKNLEDVQSIQRKFLVISALKKAVQNIENEEAKEKLLLVIDTVLPSIIDTLINVSKGLINLTKVKQISWFKKIFCCLNI